MPKQSVPFQAFNRGLISPLALGRTDVERTQLSAEVHTNWLPKTQGAMRLRPGSKYLGSTRNDTGAAFIEFIANTTNTALLELTPNVMRIRDTGDGLISRPSRQTAIGAASVSADTGAWVSKSTGGGVIGFGDTGLRLNAVNIGGIAKATAKIALGDTGDMNNELGLAINIVRGPVTFMCGNDTGDDSYFERTDLRTGYHSLAITPTDTGGLHFTFQSEELVDRKVGSLDFDDTGVVSITTPWGFSNLDDIRGVQSADVVFVACYAVRQQRIERRGDGRSWSVVDYVPTDGPFYLKPTSKARLSVSATYGNTTMNASQNFFKAGHVGTLIRMLHDSQDGVYTFASANTYSDVWSVTGIGSTTERRTSIVTTGFGTANLRVQRSFEGPDSGFRTVSTITTNTTTNVDDADDNITVYYRLAIPIAGDYSSGTIKAVVSYPGGGKEGVARVIKYNSATSVDVEVLSRFSDTGESDDWAESRWSTLKGFPSSVALHDGRLGWFGGTQSILSVSDDFENFNTGTEGDSAPIIRTIATGPVDQILAAASLLRLFIFTASEEIALRSSSLDEPLTPTNITAKPVSSQGAANVRALTVDDRAVYVQRGQKRVFMLAFSEGSGDYRPQELTLLVPDLLSGIAKIAVQRQPDTVFHFVMDDGTVARLTYQAQEEVLCWYLHKSTAADGFIENVAVLPGIAEDKVYYLVKRTINGETKRYLERQATEAESNGDTGANWLMDCAIEATRAHGGAISGLGHLEGEKVVVWGGKDYSPDDTGGNQMTYTVTSGAITVTDDTGDAAITCQVGLPYIKRVTNKEMDGEWKSAKLAYASAMGSPLTMKKRVDQLGLVLGKTHVKGLFWGEGLDTGDLYPLPSNIAGETLQDTGTDPDRILPVDTEFSPMPFGGKWATDPRLCLAAKAPRIATVMAAITTQSTEDKV